MSRYLVAFTLCVSVSALVFLGGCGRDEAPEVPSAPAPKEKYDYTKDPKFHALMKEGREATQELARTKAKLQAQMKKMVDAMRAQMKGATDAAVKAALEKDAEWNSLYKRMADVNAALDDHRKHLTEKFGKFITPVPKGSAAATDVADKTISK